MSNNRVTGPVDSRLEGIWVPSHDMPPKNCLVVNFPVPAFLGCEGIWLDLILVTLWLYHSVI